MSGFFRLTARRVNTPAGIEPCELGESPTWDDEHQVLWWIDILGEALYIGQPGENSPCDFDRVVKLPLHGHRPGFIVHASAADVTSGGDANKPALRCAAPYHAIWGSQQGLFYTCYSTSLPWHTTAQPIRHPPLSVSSTVQHCRIAHFPQSLFQPQGGGRVYRFNDGKVGPDGSLWCGGMMERTRSFPKRDRESGLLLQWIAGDSARTPSLSTPSMASNGFSVGVPNVTVSNGIGWSPAGDVLYHIDTPAAVIRAYPYRGARMADGSAGALQKGGGVKEGGHVYWALPDALRKRGATLDGLCVDTCGAVWVALAGIGEVVRLQAGKAGGNVAEDVSITGVVRLPEVSLSTSCCFGGDDLTTLYITTARGTSKEAVASCNQGGAGWIYAANLKGIAKGMPASRLRLPVSRLSISNQHHL
ncbi:hypothetical protein JKF63_03541 [Porcisia hertigi]|uniref:SMP-30/Gluconolactonase/LRE-like region domain-containing protein n=1 Tax=Porcisia hertigi TaxID=2761500 RepID=A0A836IH06_9TRYP|nr:hypothetical protein JKF63_03541 [Porcisia hertigi]